MFVANIRENAKVACKDWGSLSASDRVKYLKKLRLAIVKNLDELVENISQATGKVPVEAITTEVLTVLDSMVFLEKHAVKMLANQKVPTPIMFLGKRSYIHYQPYGTVLVISPWNFPFQLSLIPALNAAIAGNTVIIKPSEVTPQIGKIIDKLLNEAGFPKHIIQVVQGDHQVGADLVASKPDFIFFTGSVTTGKKIQQEAAQHLIPTILELGGKDPMIVFPDANLPRAVQGALWGGFTNSGQVCMSVERLFVHQSIYPEFVEMLVPEIGQLKPGIDEHGDLGLMTSLQQCKIVQEQVEDALAKGAQMLTGEEPAKWDLDQTRFISPIVLAHVTPEMLLWHEETFGPVLSIIPFNTEEEVLKLCNESNFGLSASVWTNNLDFARKFASKLVVGNVMINDVITSIGNPYLPFGGAKSSGIGRYHGSDGLRVFTNQVSVMMDAGKRKSELNWYPYNNKYQAFKQLVISYYGAKKEWSGLFKAIPGLFCRKKV